MIPELLAPAGSSEALDAAVGEGADAVYLGLKNFNARMRTSNFTYSQFEGTLRSLHRMGKKLYVTVNTVFEQREADRMYQLLKYLSETGLDGIIVQDFGVVRMVRDNFPSLKLHASTQMNIASSRGVNLLSKYGFSRVVLARELDLDEIRGIREQTNMELEVFVHGALCVSASGICLFSSYLGGKSANRGMCAQACRRFYHDEERGGYYFSPADLQLLELVPDLIDAGVNSFKIEDRMKSAEYVGTVVSAYRKVLDSLETDRDRAIAEGQSILKNDFARAKTRFYYDQGKTADWLNPEQSGGTGISLGPILSVEGRGETRRALIAESSMTLAAGDSVRFHRSDDSARESHKLKSAERDARGRTAISVPEGFGKGDSVYLIQTKAMSRRYAPVVPRDLSAYKRAPGRDKAPAVPLPPLKKNDPARFPEGIYIGVSRIEDLYIVQSERPAKVVLGYTRKNAATLLGRKPVPFGPGQLILSMDPYFPQAMEDTLTKEIPELLALGYSQFIVNNPGHYSYFRNTKAKLIAGPYLYMFNRWAYGFVSGLGAADMVPPLENNRQNLEKTIPEDRRSGCFITVFAYPALFRMRSDLSGVYEFQHFHGNRDEGFMLMNSNDGSMVIPDEPFSIVDKIPFLSESGFKRFIVDFSGPPLKKKDFRDVMAAVKNGAPLPRTRRFNWKNGFFTPKDV
ncbi:U32 family peptidase [Treponema sp. OttesenSCG-928-L16]|nr:U32 family peptidase [Treponema sp. OttesenSCG-928-L16]